MRAPRALKVIVYGGTVMKCYVGLDAMDSRVEMFNSRKELNSFVSAEPFFRKGVAVEQSSLRKGINEGFRELGNRLSEVI